MRIACPACEATYEIPEELIGAGRRLRCAKCGHAWLAQPPAAAPGAMPAGRTAAEALRDAMPPAVPEGGPADEGRAEAARDLPPPRPAPRRLPQLIDPPLPRPGDGGPPKAWLWLAWAASILLVLLLIVVMWVFQEDIVAAWPPAARLYRALGLTVGG